jgi:hypothetical protein
MIVIMVFAASMYMFDYTKFFNLVFSCIIESEHGAVPLDYIQHHDDPQCKFFKAHTVTAVDGNSARTTIVVISDPLE